MSSHVSDTTVEGEGRLDDGSEHKSCHKPINAASVSTGGMTRAPNSRPRFSHLSRRMEGLTGSFAGSSLAVRSDDGVCFSCYIENRLVIDFTLAFIKSPVRAERVRRAPFLSSIRYLRHA